MDPIFDQTMPLLSGEEKPLADFKGDVLLIVNVASACGFTPQYEGLQKLQDEFGARGFHVLAFPCNQFGKQESGSSDEIASFCSTNYGVSFPVFQKIEVNGDGAVPLYRHLKKEAKGLLGTEAVKWNFTKFLVGRNGKVLDRYASATKPTGIRKDIERALEAPKS